MSLQRQSQSKTNAHLCLTFLLVEMLLQITHMVLQEPVVEMFYT